VDTFVCKKNGAPTAELVADNDWSQLGHTLPAGPPVWPDGWKGGGTPGGQDAVVEQRSGNAGSPILN
jgi:hypothetical protein